MTKNAEKALNNLIIKIDELVKDLEEDEILNDDEKLELAYVYKNVFDFVKREDFEHNVSILNNDKLKREFNLRELDL